MPHDTMPEAGCQDLLAHVFAGQAELYERLAPGGLEHAPFGEHAAPKGDEDEQTAWLRLLGNVVWETFSNNNEVVAEDGRVYDLGSWRGTGSTLADFLNATFYGGERRTPPDEDALWEAVQEMNRAAKDLMEGRGDTLSEAAHNLLFGADAAGPFGYLDFYMGLMGGGEEHLPLYRYVFERLRERGCSWRFAPPSLHVVSVPPLPPEAEDYDPAEALQQDAKREEADEETEALRRQLAEGNEEAFHRAAKEPPVIVQAYRAVYDEPPRYLRSGW